MIVLNIFIFFLFRIYSLVNTGDVSDSHEFKSHKTSTVGSASENYDFSRSHVSRPGRPLPPQGLMVRSPSTPCPLTVPGIAVCGLHPTDHVSYHQSPHPTPDRWRRTEIVPETQEWRLPCKIGVGESQKKKYFTTRRHFPANIRTFGVNNDRFGRDGGFLAFRLAKNGNRKNRLVQNEVCPVTVCVYSTCVG